MPAITQDQLRDFWSWLDGNRAPKPRASRTRPAASRPANYGYAITGSGKRKRPSAERKRQVLNAQGHRCLYCEQPFGVTVKRGRRTITLRLHWDHFIPFAYGLTNSVDNWVAACHVCNQIKGPRVFDTVRKAQRYILQRWVEKGYALATALERAEMGVDL